MPTAPIQVILKNSTTTISAKAFDERSSEKVMALVGLNDEIVAIPKDNVAAIIMDPDAAKDYFGK